MKSFVAFLLPIMSIVMQDEENAKKTFQTPPTEITKSLLRGGPGSYLHNRGDRNPHQGVDIVANQSSMDKEIYVVKAVSGGTIAYAALNPNTTSGYGYTLVIDHGTDFYTLYAHLAYNASKSLVKVGQDVAAGQTIGYMADPTNNEKSTGNIYNDVVKPYDKIMVHIEIFKSVKGRRGSSIADLKKDGTVLNPTKVLENLGYSSF